MTPRESGAPPRTRAEEAALLRAAIEASGLSARRWAQEVALRDERTIRRWLAGDAPIPHAVLVRLEEGKGDLRD